MSTTRVLTVGSGERATITSHSLDLMSNSILNEIMAVTNDGTTEDGNSSKAHLLAYPGEKPTKSQMLEWKDAWIFGFSN